MTRNATALFPAAFLAASALPAPPALAGADPPYDATADTVFGINRDDDSSFVCLGHDGRTIRRMWDKRRNAESDLDILLFRARFSDGPAIGISMNPEFRTIRAARAEAGRYTRRLGQLPPVSRQGIGQLGIHMGNEGFHGGPGKIFVHAGKSDLRIRQKRPEESLLHEPVHASLDRTVGTSPRWIASQRRNGGFATRYGTADPDREDLAETALFAYGILRRPGRIPPLDSQVIERRIPARIAVLAETLNTPARTPPARHRHRGADDAPNANPTRGPDRHTRMKPLCKDGPALLTGETHDTFDCQD